MKTILIYCSKTGFTKKYAMWLKEMFPCTVVALDEGKKTDLSPYDTVLFASWFHAGSILSLDWFKKLDLKGRRKAVLATGASPAGSPEIGKAIENNFKDDLNDYQVFYLPGGLCYEKMGTGDKMMMKVFAHMMAKKPDKTEYEKQMAAALGSSFDLTDKRFLEPVVRYLETAAVSD